MLGSRPDLAYSINKLVQYSSKPSERHWQGVTHILRFVKRTASTALILGRRESILPHCVLGEIVEKTVTGYFDAAYMDDTTDRHSAIGYVFFYKESAVSWESKKQQTIASSTTEAEYLAGTEVTKESMCILSFLEGIGYPVLQPARLLGDNQGANALALNPQY